jgi:hypothetical protein
MWEAVQSEGFLELRRDFNRANGVVQSAPVHRDSEAADLWGYDSDPSRGVYAHLTRERHGLFGVSTGRAAAQVLRLSLIYALLDACRQITRQHQDAALEVWRYAEDSAKFVFGDALGDPTADEILRALQSQPGGLTRTEIRNLSDRHKSSSETDRALLVLHDSGRARFEKQPTNGRSIERWFVVQKGEQ